MVVCAVERVRPGFRRTCHFTRRPAECGLAVLQPVAEAGRIAPGDIEDRTIRRLAVAARDRVAVAARNAALRNADGRILWSGSHGLTVVQPIGVRFRHGVEERRVLAHRHIVLAQQRDARSCAATTLPHGQSWSTPNCDNPYGRQYRPPSPKLQAARTLPEGLFAFCQVPALWGGRTIEQFATGWIIPFAFQRWRFRWRSLSQLRPSPFAVLSTEPLPARCIPSLRHAVRAAIRRRRYEPQ